MIGHRVVIRPRSLLETGDLALTFIRAHRPQFLRLLPWTLVPAAIAWALNTFFSWDSWQALALEWAMTTVTCGVYTVLCGDLMLQPSTSLRSVQRRFFVHSPVYLVSRLAGALLLAVSWWTLVTYGFVLFTPEASLLERGTVGASFTRSSALSRAAPGRAVAFAIASIIVLCAGAWGAELIHLAMRELFGLQVQSIAPWEDKVTWAEFAGLALVQPFLATFRFLLYIDCRTRREGWDLQVQFRALVNALTSQPHHKPIEEAA